LDKQTSQIYVHVRLDHIVILMSGSSHCKKTLRIIVFSKRPPLNEVISALISGGIVAIDTDRASIEKIKNGVKEFSSENPGCHIDVQHIIPPDTGLGYFHILVDLGMDKWLDPDKLPSEIATKLVAKALLSWEQAGMPLNLSIDMYY
jgi:hypothetical protein